MIENIDVSTLRENPTLGEGEQAIAMVKWVNQSYHDENLKSMFNGQWDKRADVSRVNAGRHRQQYYPGLIASFDLGVDYLDSSAANTVKNEVQPTDIDVGESSIALAAGNRILVRKTLEAKDDLIIEHPWFARLHSVERIKENEFLTVSSSFDQLYVVDSMGNVLWHLDAWSEGRNVNKFGHMLLAGLGVRISAGDRVNPEVTLLKEPNDTPGRANVITDPSAYKGLGLPTYLTPTFVNHVAYDRSTGKVLATTLNSGECWHVDLDTGDVNVVLEGLIKPHGLRNFGNGYLVTDSGREHILVLDPNFKVQKRYDISTFQDRKEGLEKALWLQNTTQLHSGLLATISTPRQKLTLIDSEKNEYRDIPYDNEWGMQTIKSYPER